MLQGHVEAYGDYEEIQAQGVELMEFIKPQSADKDEVSELYEGEYHEEKSEVEKEEM